MYVSTNSSIYVYLRTTHLSAKRVLCAMRTRAESAVGLHDMLRNAAPTHGASLMIQT